LTGTPRHSPVARPRTRNTRALEMLTPNLAASATAPLKTWTMNQPGLR
jgi:hypothetical protein